LLQLDTDTGQASAEEEQLGDAGTRRRVKEDQEVRKALPEPFDLDGSGHVPRVEIMDKPAAPPQLMQALRDIPSVERDRIESSDTQRRFHEPTRFTR